MTPYLVILSYPSTPAALDRLTLPPAARVMDTPTRSARAHLLEICNDYRARRNMRKVRHVEAAEMRLANHGLQDCGPLLPRMERKFLRYKTPGHPTSEQDAEIQISLNILAGDDLLPDPWRFYPLYRAEIPAAHGAPPLFVESIGNPDHGLTPHKAILRIWLAHLARHGVAFRLSPRTLPPGSRPRRIGVGWGDCLDWSRVPGPDEPHPVTPPKGGRPVCWTLLMHPALPAPLALPGGSRRDWRTILRQRLGLEPNQRLTGVRKVTVKVPPEGAEVLD